MIRVLVVDDSLVARKWAVQCVQGHPEMQVVGEASEGAQAVKLTRKLSPDVIVMDMAMPLMNGVEATRQIMGKQPTPILIVSGSQNRTINLQIIDALKAGAVDAFDKPREGEDKRHWEERFLHMLRIVSRVKVIRHVNGGLPAPRVRRAAEGPVKLVAIGASTGGPQLVASILGALPPLPVPLLVLVHFPESLFTEFVGWLASAANIPVVAASDGDPLNSLAGVVSVAAPERHLLIKAGRLSYSDAPPENHCRPSVDVLFRSVAETLDGRSLGVLLTGMGRDGAAGLLQIRQAGGMTIAQDEATSVVFGMPKAAIELGAAEQVLPADEIAPAIALLCQQPVCEATR